MSFPLPNNKQDNSPSDSQSTRSMDKSTDTISGRGTRSNSPNQIPELAQENENDDDEGKIYVCHTNIVKEWCIGNGESTKKPDWDRRFKKLGGGKTLIHRAISEINARITENKPLKMGEALQLIETLVLEQPDIFVTHSTNIKPAMFEAAESQPDILFRVISLLISTSTVEKLRDENEECKDNETCPLLSVAKGRLNQCPKEGSTGTAGGPDKTNQLGGPKASDETGDASKAAPVPEKSRESPENSGTQCLHSRIDVKQVLEKDSELRHALANLLSSHDKAFAECLRPLLRRKQFYVSKTANDRQIIEPEAFNAFLQLCPDTFFTHPPSSGPVPLQEVIKCYDPREVIQLNEKEMFNYGLLSSIIRGLIDRCPTSIFVETEKMTAYRLLKSFGPGESKIAIKSRPEIEQLLKRVCIGSEKKWAEKKEYLYWDAKAQHHFRLNLIGESAILDKKYISMMREKSGMRFEAALEFIKLSYWRLAKVQALENEALDTHDAQLVGKKDEQTDKDPYEDIFQWLRQLGVQKIFAVEVDDDGPEPHEMRETVAQAAPDAREVHLYSHGNPAILRSWAYSPGLGNLKHLQKLVIEIYPQNPNGEMDCKSFEEEFIKNIIQQCPQLKHGAIEFNNHGVAPNQDVKKLEDGRNLISSMANQLDTAKVLESPAWLGRLSNYIQFMSDLEGLCTPVSESACEPLAVKVAILDNGCKLIDLEGIQIGQSFRSDNEEFFVGPCSHGTEMARCVRDVCPKAELLIARLDDSRKRENQHFTIDSCCEALRWAIDMEADIISMSWSFKRTRYGNLDETNFKTLIEEAARKNILLFASLPDKPLEETSQFAPVSLEGVIKIGSATVFGESSKENKYARPDFLLPEEGITLPNGETAKGSSFSTAYASGLAASLLYCLKAHEVLFQPGEEDPYHKALRLAKTSKGMRDIFGHLGSTTNYPSGEAAFVQPYQHLPHEFGVSEDDMKTNLQTIVTRIIPNKDLHDFY